MFPVTKIRKISYKIRKTSRYFTWLAHILNNCLFVELKGVFITDNVRNSKF